MYGQDVNIRDGTTGTRARVEGDGSLRISGDVNTTVSVGNVAIRDADDANIKAKVYTGGALRISGDVQLAGVSVGDGAILDGVTNTIRATVKDFSNSKPLTVALVNVSGDVYNSGGGSGIDPVGLKNVVGSTVNPATEDTLADRVGVGKITAPVGVSGDVSTIPKSGQVWPVNDNSGSLTVDGTVNIGTIPNVNIAKIYDAVDVSGDVAVVATDLDIRDLVIGDKITIGAVTASVGISGDVSTKPLAGQIWNVREQSVSGKQLVGSSIRLGVSGDVGLNAGTNNIGDVDVVSSVPLTIGRITEPIGISGDVNISVTIGDVITVGKVTTPIGVSGDVSTKPKFGEVWPVSDNSVSLTVDVGTALPAGTNNIGDVNANQKGGWKVAVSGDVNVTATNLDIRDLTSVSDSVTLGGSLPAGSNNIGDVDVVSSVPLTIGNITTPVGISGDINVSVTVGDVITVGKITSPVGVSGDIFTKPLAGQVWDVNQQGVVGNQVVGSSIRLGVSGDVGLNAGDNNIGNIDIVSSVPLTIGNMTAPIGISGDVFVRPSTTQASTQPLSVRLTDGTDYYNASGGGVQTIGKVTAPIGISGDVDITPVSPVASDYLPIRLTDGSSFYNALSSDLPITIGKITAPVGISGDVSISGAVTSITNPITVGKVTAPIGVSGDIDVTPASPVASDYLPIRLTDGTAFYNALSSDLSLTIGKITAPVGVSGDVSVSGTITSITNPITVGKITAPVGISGDVSTIPKSGEVWSVREQGVAGIQVVGGISSTVGISGDQGVELIDSGGTNRATIFSTGSVKVSGDRIVCGNGDYGNVSVTTIATIVIGSRVDLKQATFVPLGTIWYGLNNSVSSSNGKPMFSGDVYTDGGEGIYTGDIYAVTDAGSVGVRYERRW